MAEEKTYVFGEGSNNMLPALIASMFNQRGMDASQLMGMMNGCGGFGGMGFIWIIFLFLLWGRNGWGNNDNGGLANMINNDTGRELLQQAIAGNGDAIRQLATTLHCDTNAIQSTLCSLQASVQGIGSQIGLTGQQVINAIQSGNMSIASQLASCCCDIRESITKQGYDNQLATLNQTNVLGSKIDVQTTLINDKFCQLELRGLQNKIDTLREEKTALLDQLGKEHQTNAIQAFQAQTIAPVTAALSALQSEVNDIKCKLPESVNVPYSPVVGVPTCLATQYGLGLGYGYGAYGYNNGYWG